MNQLRGKVLSVTHNTHMSLVEVSVGVFCFSATLLETPSSASYLKPEADVMLVFKETEVALGKGLQGQLSLRNRVPVTVLAIARGDIMSVVTLDLGGHSIQSVITTNAVDQMQLAQGNQIEALIKSNEIALMEAKA